ncbi:MAG: aminotransferase class V-fold PLP-dependent enzyme [Deltaproteobacteria bacterium]|nr:aminotransferase class V-fold PLP-dependent enzyme [Deltaproteobacteria bacterium]
MSDEVDTYIYDLFASAENWLSPNQGTATQIVSELSRFLHEPGKLGSPPLSEVFADFNDTQIPNSPIPPQGFFTHLLREIIPRAVKTSSPQFIGHMTSALPGYVFVMSQLLAVLNQNIVKVETSGVLTLYERQAIAMLHRLVFNQDEAFYQEHTQASQSTLGMMVTGGTLANIAALWCARNAALGPNKNHQGIDNTGFASVLQTHKFSRAVIIGSTLMHFSAEKAADIMGMGANAIIRVPVNSAGKIDTKQLRCTIAQCHERNECIIALIGLAGSTEVGSVDPLDELADIAQEHKIHLHVDAAWGGPVLFSEQYRHLLSGIERADSVTIDGHKQLYTPIGLGTVLLRNPKLATGIEKVANYIAREASLDLGKRTLEGSRPALSLYVHAALATLGRRGLAWLIDQGMAKTKAMRAQIIARPEFELLAEPELNIMVYRYIPISQRQRIGHAGVEGPNNKYINEVNKQIQEQQFTFGTGFVSRTLLTHTHYGSKVPIMALRAVLANPLTSDEHLRAVLDEQLELATAIETNLQGSIL